MKKKPGLRRSGFLFFQLQKTHLKEEAYSHSSSFNFIVLSFHYTSSYQISPLTSMITKTNYYISQFDTTNTIVSAAASSSSMSPPTSPLDQNTFSPYPLQNELASLDSSVGLSASFY